MLITIQDDYGNILERFSINTDEASEAMKRHSVSEFIRDLIDYYVETVDVD